MQKGHKNIYLYTAMTLEKPVFSWSFRGSECCFYTKKKEVLLYGWGVFEGIQFKEGNIKMNWGGGGGEKCFDLKSEAVEVAYNV